MSSYGHYAGSTAQESSTFDKRPNEADVSPIGAAINQLDDLVVKVGALVSALEGRLADVAPMPPSDNPEKVPRAIPTCKLHDRLEQIGLRLNAGIGRLDTLLHALKL